MTSRWSPKILVFAAIAFHFIVLPFKAKAQDQPNAEQAPQDLWSFLKKGRISLNVRYRFEVFERDGAPFTAPSYAPTLRIALGYKSPTYYGFSFFAEGESVTVTGPADYSVPALPSQNEPNRPAILDPKSLQANQFYVNWERRIENKKLAITVGRQELAWNDRRFLGVSYWRQVHGTFDAARLTTELPHDFSFDYTFVNRLYRVDGYNARDGSLPMHSHLWNLVWSRPDKFRIAQYGLLLDYHSPAQFTNSTQTYGIRASGPYKFNANWNLIYTAEFAKQKNYGRNPNHVDANYFLGELGPGWRNFGFNAGYAFLAGHSRTDLLTTPAAPPFNGWTDLFINNPILGNASGLEARYLTATGPIRFLGGTTGTVIFYDYHSDVFHLHYGKELDLSLAHKFKKFGDRLEVGWRFGRYWADQLFTNSVRTSVYTSFTL